MGEQEIGKVTHWFGHIGVAGIELSDTLSVGARIRIRGHTTDFESVVDSMQIDREEVETAGPGDDIGIKFAKRARVSDKVYLVESE